MLSFKQFLDEHILDHLAGGSSGHYGHLADNAFHGAKSAVAGHALMSKMVDKGGKNGIEGQKKTDGSVSVVTVKNSKNSPFHNPSHPESAVGVAYKGRMAAKTVPDNERVSYSADDIKKHYGEGHHLVAPLTTLLQHAHKIHASDSIIQHDIHSTDPKKDLTHNKDGSVSWQPNTIKNTAHGEEAKKISNAKVILASHTKLTRGKDGELEGTGLAKSDLKQHNDVYNVNLDIDKPTHSQMYDHLRSIASHIQSKEQRAHLDKVGSASYNGMLERFTNSKVNAGEYGGKEHSPLSHSDFRKFTEAAHNKEIDKAKSEKGKAAKTAERDKQLGEIDSHKSSIEHAFKLHNTMTHAAHDYVNFADKNDKSPITHELPDGKGGFSKSKPEGFVPRTSKFVKPNGQKINQRAEFNKTNKMMSQRFANESEELDESVENFNRTSNHAVVTTGRFSPFHQEHNAMLDAVADHAKANKADPHVFVTKSYNTPDGKNPLKPTEKVAIMRKLKPGMKQNIHSETNIFGALGKLHKKGYTKATVVLGDDRVDDGTAEKIKQYNGKFDKKGNGYHFPDGIHVMSRHEIHNTRSAEGGDGVHASDIRKAAISGDHEFLKKNMTGSDAKGNKTSLSDGLVNAVAKRIRDRVKK